MDSPFIAAGAQVPPGNSACLHTNEFFTGMWTQGNPLGAGAVPYLQQKYYSASRFDRLIGGQNTEITTRLTLARRPGNSVYNAGAFPPINRFYEFRAFSGSTEQIHVLASVDADILTEDLTVSNVQVITIGPIGFRWPYLIVTFTTPVPAVTTGQTYTFSGVTSYPAINGLSIVPFALSTRPLGVPDPPGLTAFQQAFTYAAANYGPAADTGDALVSPVSGSSSVRDVTGPGNNQVLWSKNPLAGRTGFQSVGNICFFGDGYDTRKWVQSGLSWTALTAFNQGDFIVDTNNNLQLAIGAQQATVTDVLVKDNVCTLFLSSLTPLSIPIGTMLNLAGMTTIAALAGTTKTVTALANSLQVTFAFVHADVPFSAETGTVSTGASNSGAAPPAWSAVRGGVTQDASVQWECMGPAVEIWGIQTPTVAPTVTQVAAPSIYNGWAANTWYAAYLFVIVDSNGNVQQLTTGGVTGGVAPAWSLVVGGVTADGTANWTCLGPAAWSALHVYPLGAVVNVTFTYWITVGHSIPYPPYVTYTQESISVTLAFECTTAGTSAASFPDWNNGNGTTVSEGTGLVWTNIGPAPAWPGAAQALSVDTVILDSNGNLQKPGRTGITGAVVPVWKTDTGATTADTVTQEWVNAGPYTPAATGPRKWAYSGKNSVTGHIGTASPVSVQLIVSKSNQAVLQAPGLPNDPQIDSLVLWRTLQDGSTLLYLDTIPNPAVGATANSWIYTDTTPDSGLNEFIIAPIAHKNDLPPAGFVPQAYYLNRIWGWVANKLRWSGGPDTVTGSGDEAFPPGNEFTFPSLGVTCWATSIGLFCYTNSDVWVVLGQGTANSPFYVINFQSGVGLANQDAFAVNGSTAYGMLTSGQVVSMDPGAGELEIGFPIGDRFDAEYTAAGTYMAWHQGSSADTALYAGDGALGWYRMAAVAAPESGNVWSPRALIVNGVKALASIEIAPGQKRLLLGPATQGAPILMRDVSASEDGGQAYPATAIIGSIVMAQPGTTVGIQFVVTEEKAIVGSKPVSIGLLYDEITGVFSNLTKVTNDPPNLPGSVTVTTRRFWAMQDAQPVICRHMQTEISWAAEGYANELMTYSIYGRLPEKARR